LLLADLELHADGTQIDVENLTGHGGHCPIYLASEYVVCEV
jgi:hypothetical protein